MECLHIIPTIIVRWTWADYVDRVAIKLLTIAWNSDGEKGSRFITGTYIRYKEVI